MIISKLASAIYNEIQGGLAGYESTVNMSLEQLEDEIIEERLWIIAQYSKKNIIPRKDLFYAINCIELDCASIDKCCQYSDSDEEKISHFQIPQTINDFGEQAIEFIGSVNKEIKFTVYTSTAFKFHKYKRRGSDKPYVFVDTTPNQNNMYDCYVFNAPLLERLSVVAIFKDPRQLSKYLETTGCCNLVDSENYTWIDTEIKQNIINKKLRYYKQYPPQPVPNTQNPA